MSGHSFIYVHMNKQSGSYLLSETTCMLAIVRNDSRVHLDELEKEGKHRDAWMKVPDPSEYPEQAEAIRKRKSSLSLKFAPDLFGATATPVTDEQPQSVEANVEEEEINQ